MIGFLIRYYSVMCINASLFITKGLTDIISDFFPLPLSSEV